jgi:hypothetical protein
MSVMPVILDAAESAGFKLVPSIYARWDEPLMLAELRAIAVNDLQLWTWKMQRATYPKARERDPVSVHWLMLWAKRPGGTDE